MYYEAVLGFAGHFNTLFKINVMVKYKQFFDSPSPAYGNRT